LSRGFAIASPHADDPPPNRTDWRKPESQIARKPTTNTPFLGKTVISDPLLRRSAQRRGGSSRPTLSGSPDAEPRSAPYAGRAFGRYSSGKQPSTNAVLTKTPQMTAHKAIDSATTKIRADASLSRDDEANRCRLT